MGWETLGSLVGDVGGSYLQNEYATRRQHGAQDFAHEQFAGRYQMTVDDLKRAGLNPMLAYQNGPGSSPGSSAASAGESHIGSRAIASYNETKVASANEAALTAGAQKSKAESIKAEQDTKTSAALERKTDSETLINAGIPALIAAQVTNNIASANQAEMAAAKIGEEIYAVRAQVESLKSQVDKNKSDIKLNNSLIEANNYLNQLRTVEAYLVNARVRNAALEGDILSPKAHQAKTFSAEAGAAADNIGKIGEAAWKFMFPTLINTGNSQPVGFGR